MTQDEKNMLFIDGYRSGYEDAKKQWQGLTDEEINKVFAMCRNGSLHELARAIEAKLKEKNQ